MQAMIVNKIIKFWFGNLDNKEVGVEQSNIWWKKNLEVDNYIVENFHQYVLDAMAGKFEDCLDKPKSTLAVIILLDQFTRHIYRNTAEAFSADQTAQKLSQASLNLQHNKGLSLFERVFLYMPFEHAEDLLMQEKSVALFHDLYTESPASHRETFKMYYENAIQHKDIIDRFGRFPHRNEILKRVSTSEEKQFLSGPNSKF